MIRNISIGVDIGTSAIKVVAAEFLKGEKNPKIIGAGEAETRGVRHGYITNIPEAAASLKKAIASAEKNSGIKIRHALVSIGGTTLRGDAAAGTSVVSKADGEVTELDISKALDNCEDNLNLNNKKIIKVLPLSFKLDGKEILGRPEGMRGTKLEVKALFITCSASHFEDLLETITSAGLEPLDIVAAPFSGSFIALTEKQKIVGGALVDIGSESTSLSVFENGTALSLHTFPIGGADITNDIALGMKISLEDAERLKLGNLPAGAEEEFSRKKLDEIIEARLFDIFELIENHLKKIKRNGLLPAGAVFIGGGANIPGLEEFSKSALKLPSKIGTAEIFGNAKTKLRDPSWFNALGLVFSPDGDDFHPQGQLGNLWKNLKNILKSNIRQLVP